MRILDRLNQYLSVMGIPGLLVVAFLDSAAVPMVGGPDALVLLLSWQRPALGILIVAAAVVGSTLGCLVLHGIGRKSGEKALSRFDAAKRGWVKKKMDQNGVWAVMAAVMAPPPFPTKLLILAAGVLQTGRIRFTAAVAVGRLIRYSIVSYLGARFGDQAARILKANYGLISLILIGVILLVLILRHVRNRPGIDGEKTAPSDKR